MAVGLSPVQTGATKVIAGGARRPTRKIAAPKMGGR